MQTSDKKTGRAVIRVICFFVIAVLLNALLTFAVTPAYSPSQEMWRHYYAAENRKLDMVYVGTSMSYTSINPEITDRITGFHSYNMGTNAQSYANSLTALQRAVSDHHISRAVLVLDYAYLEKGMENHGRPDAIFVHSMNQGRPLPERVKNAASFLFDPDYFGKSQSLNFWFPWISSATGGSADHYIQNMGAKLGLVTLKPGDDNNVRNRYGYKPYRQKINYNQIRETQQTWSKKDLSRDSMKSLDEICALCKRKQVKLTVIVTPGPVSQVLSYGNSYFDRMKKMQQFFADRGASFYDFHLAKQKLYAGKPEYYKDNDHLNVDGARVFSRSLARVLLAEKEGKKPSGWFYTPEEYLKSIDYIDSVIPKVTAENGKGIRLNALAYTGPEVSVQYAYRIREAGAGSRKGTVTKMYDYRTDPHIVYVPDKEGTYQVTVYARQSGSGNFWDRKNTATVSYWKR